jgi:serine protease Do
LIYGDDDKITMNEKNDTHEPRRAFRAGWMLALVFTMILGTGIGLVIAGNLNFLPQTHASNVPTTFAAPQALDNSGTNILKQTQDSFRQIVQMAKPAVVTIETKKEITGAQNYFFGPGDDMFFNPFKDRMPDPKDESQKQYDITGGSGFFISDDGYILTNNHVVSDSVEITITTDEHVEYKAELVGTDPMTDVALLKIDSSDSFPYLDLGNSENAQIGDWVIAIGSPIKLAQTVTVGVISGKNREDVQIGNIDYSNFIQTDAAINFGNSGGPLLDINGKVIGINTAIAGGVNVSGIGFAIPSNLAKFAYENLKSHGEVVRGWVGVTIQAVDTDLAKSLGLKKPTGAMVNSVIPGDPADKAGIKVGDLILEIDGVEVPSNAALSRMIAEKEIGKPVKFKILRNNQKIDFTVTPSKRPSNTSSRVNQPGGSAESESKLGLTLGEITPDIRENLGIPGNVNGIIVKNVKQNSVAADKMFFRNDVISEIDDTPVKSISDYENAVTKASGRVAKFKVYRQQLTGEGWISFFIGVPVE